MLVNLLNLDDVDPHIFEIQQQIFQREIKECKQSILMTSDVSIEIRIHDGISKSSADSPSSGRSCTPQERSLRTTDPDLLTHVA